MKCYHCGKYINKSIRRIKDKLGFTIYSVKIKETDVVHPLCKECGPYYQKIVQLIETYGEEFVMDALKIQSEMGEKE